MYGIQKDNYSIIVREYLKKPSKKTFMGLLYRSNC